MRGIIPGPLGQMREYAGHLSRQSILDFSLSSCACSLWHSPPLHSHSSWLKRLFSSFKIHYVTWSCMRPRLAKLPVGVFRWIALLLLFFFFFIISVTHLHHAAVFHMVAGVGVCKQVLWYSPKISFPWFSIYSIFFKYVFYYYYQILFYLQVP